MCAVRNKSEAATKATMAWRSPREHAGSVQQAAPLAAADTARATRASLAAAKATMAAPEAAPKATKATKAAPKATTKAGSAPKATKAATKAAPEAATKAKSSEIKSTQDLLDEFAESKDYASRSIEIGNLVHWHSHLTRAIIDIDVQVKQDSMQASNGWQPAYNCMARALSPEEITKILAVMAELEHNPNDICMEHKDVWMHSRLHVPSRVASLRAKIKAGETIYGVFDSNHRLAGMLLLAENVSAPTFTLQRRFLVCPYLATTPLVLTTAMSMLLNKAHALGRTPSLTDSLYHYYQIGLRLQAAQHGRNFTLSATRIIAELTAAGVHVISRKEAAAMAKNKDDKKIPENAVKAAHIKVFFEYIHVLGHPGVLWLVELQTFDAKGIHYRIASLGEDEQHPDYEGDVGA